MAQSEPTGDDRATGTSAATPLPLWALLVVLLVVPAAVIGLASAGSWLGVLGIAIIVLGTVAVIVRWSARW